MRTKTDINIDVVVNYLDIEDLRFAQTAFADSPMVQWDCIRATMRIDEKGGKGTVWITGQGKKIKKNGEVGLASASIRFGHRVLDRMPPEWAQRILTDLGEQAERISVSAA